MLSSNNNSHHHTESCVKPPDQTAIVVILKSKQEKRVSVKMKNRSHRKGINRPTSRHGHKYSKY